MFDIISLHMLSVHQTNIRTYNESITFSKDSIEFSNILNNEFQYEYRIDIKRLISMDIGIGN